MKKNDVECVRRIFKDSGEEFVYQESQMRCNKCNLVWVTKLDIYDKDYLVCPNCCPNCEKE